MWIVQVGIVLIRTVFVVVAVLLTLKMTTAKVVDTKPPQSEH